MERAESLARVQNVPTKTFAPQKRPYNDIFSTKMILSVFGFAENKVRKGRRKDKSIVAANIVLAQVVGTPPIVTGTAFRSMPSA